MKRLYLLAIVAEMVVVPGWSQSTRTTIFDGDAANFWVWNCFCVPGSSDNVVIRNDMTVSSNTSFNNMTVENGGVLSSSGRVSLSGDLDINSGGELSNNNRFSIEGNYTLNGIHSGTGETRMDGNTGLISGNGTMTNSGSFRLGGNSKEIQAGTVFNLQNTSLQLVGSVVVNNYGHVITTDISGNANRTWDNKSNAILEVSGTISANLVLITNAVNNTVVYNGLGSSNQTIADPQNSTYYNLVTDGDNLASRKKIRGNVIILGDLSIEGSTFDVRRQSTDWSVDIHGDWYMNGGAFDPRNGSVHFGGTGIQGIHSYLNQITFFDLSFGGSGTKTLYAELITERHLTIGSTLDVNDTAVFNVSIGGDFTNNGSFIHRNGLVTFSGNTSQDIIGQHSLYNVTLNNSNGAVIQSGRIDLYGVLTLASGNLETNDSLILISDASGTASIATITSGSISGGITMERYLPVGADNWRFLASPVSNATIESWDDDVLTMGFPGSDDPGNVFNSVRQYDETLTGDKTLGYSGISNSSDPILPTEGYLIYCGDSATHSSPFTIDVFGTPNTGNFSFNITYTSTPDSADDGWNLIGNPYPSTIDWNAAGWTKSNVNDAIYMWDPAIQQYASYVNGIGTNNGTNLIPSSQSFWVQSYDVAPILSSTENVKSSTDQPMFRKAAPDDYVKLRLIRSNGRRDETIIRLSEKATGGYDANYDARKIFTSHPAVPSIYTENSTFEYSIQAFNPITLDRNIPINVKIPASGNYRIDLSKSDYNHNLSCVVFVDLLTNVRIDLQGDTSYNCFIHDSTTTGRFALEIGGQAEVDMKPISCNSANDGGLKAIGQGAGPWSYHWYDENNNLLRTTPGVGGPDSISNLSSGSYTVEIHNSGLCGIQAGRTFVPEPIPVIAGFVPDRDTVYLSESPAVHFTNTSKGSEKHFWNFGDGTTVTANNPAHTYSQPGTYAVELKASKGECASVAVHTLTVIDHRTSMPVLDDPMSSYSVWSSGKTIYVHRVDLEDGPVQIDIITVQGELIRTETLKAGQTTLALEMKTGTHVLLVRLSSAHSSQSRRVLING